MSPAEKAALDAKASRAGHIPVGQLIRRAVEAYDESAQNEAEELRALLALLATTHAETLRQLDHAERKLDDTLAHLAAQPA
jgi:hypothetical protein